MLLYFGTDLAVEAHRFAGKGINGVRVEKERAGSLTISRMRVVSPSASEKLGKPCGTYITAEGLPLTDNFRDVGEQIKTVAAELGRLIPEKGDVLVVGIGNTNITPDSLGPKSASGVLATRHIKGELARSTGLDRLRSVSVISPGVLGNTGIEVGEVVGALTSVLCPSVVIAVDALASRSLSHLGRTIQLSDSGISPGSGVGNERYSLCEDNLGVPVIGMGVPTVVSAATVARDIIRSSDGAGIDDGGLIVTPREIDLLTERAARLIGMSINCALQPLCSFEELCELVK